LPEGDLSRVRANLVKQDTLHQLAVTGLDLPEVIRLGDGEVRSGGQKRPSILADALEALIGAVYLDAGFAAAQNLVHRLFKGCGNQPEHGCHWQRRQDRTAGVVAGAKMKLPITVWLATLGMLRTSRPLMWSVKSSNSI
jgi:ribonuclease-3